MDKVSAEDYAQLVRGVEQFLRGNTQEVEKLLARRMEQHSERMEFEKAALLRDRLQSLRTSMERQRVASHEGFDRDVIAYHAEQGEALVLVATIRAGVLTETRPFNVKDYSLPPQEVLYGFISQFYDEGRIVPPEILVSADPADRELLEQWLRDLRKGAVEL
ncbi:MAG: UvrB/UvrC motif-containing protein, partial [bacterium]